MKKQNDNKKNKNSLSSQENKEKKKRFPVAYGIYIVALLVLMGIFLLYCNKSLLLYEEAQPGHLMDEVVNELRTEGFTEAMVQELSFTAFDTKEAYLAKMNELLTTSPLTYYVLGEDFASGALIYGIYADSIKVAEVTLLPQDSYQRMYLLTITNWALGKVTPVQMTENYTLTITLPENYRVTVNGSPLSEEQLTSRAENSNLTYCADYVNVPALVTYEISGLVAQPEVEIYDATNSLISYEAVYDTITGEDGAATISGEDNADDGAATIPSNDTNSTNASALGNGTCLGKSMTIQLDYPQATMPEDLQALVFEQVQRYSNFFSKDLEGCRSSIDCIRDLFPADSIYLTLADQYRREDMGVFAPHTNTHFLNESITEYTRYSEDCFSCRVYFEKSMTLWGSREMIDVTDNIYYYVNLDGQWVIADIQ